MGQSCKECGKQNCYIEPITGLCLECYAIENQWDEDDALSAVTVDFGQIER